MIAKLRGRVDSTGDDWAVIDVGGVGYLVQCSRRTLGALPPSGTAAELCIETHVREDHINLYGFAAEAERAWFRLLISVQGVGTRLALAILSAVPLDDIARAIAAEDKALLTAAPGVGPRLAGRIVGELKERAGDLALGLGVGAATAPAPSAQGVATDAVSALVNLGYRRGDAYGVVARAMGALGEDAALDDILRVGLKELAAAGAPQ